jgi:hypothetical protein
MMKINKNHNNSIENILEINDMYVESIKAKLEVLHDLEFKK